MRVWKIQNLAFSFQLHCLFTHDKKSRKYCLSFPEVQYNEISNLKNERGVHLCAIVIHNVQVWLIRVSKNDVMPSGERLMISLHRKIVGVL